MVNHGIGAKRFVSDPANDQHKQNENIRTPMKYTESIKYKYPFALFLAGALPASLCAAPTTISQVVQADTYVSSGQPTVNFGTMGAMEIAVPTVAQTRTEESLIRFSTSAIESGFNTDYGVGNWTITSITLTLYSNFSTAGQQPGNTSFNAIAAGEFELDWLSNDSWSETGITYNTISTVLPGTGNNALDSLGDFYWPATGASSAIWTLALDPNLIGDITSGSQATIFGQPTAGSTVGYLFNTLNNSPAYLNVTADVPEPPVMALWGSGLAGLPFIRRWNRQK
jgi:hypothetical protein